MYIKMKPQLEKKKNTKEEIERERKKMGMRGQTNQIWCYQPVEVFKKTQITKGNCTFTRRESPLTFPSG